MRSLVLLAVAFAAAAHATSPSVPFEADQNNNSTLVKRCETEQECRTMKKERRMTLKSRASPLPQAPGDSSVNGNPAGGPQTYGADGHIHKFTILPGLYSIIARGAAGGKSGGYTDTDDTIYGGYGAQTGGFFKFSQTTTLHILVGSRGDDSSQVNCNTFRAYDVAGGGGGGSFVWIVRDDGVFIPLVVGGGGQGANTQETGVTADSATIVTPVGGDSAPGLGQDDCYDDPNYVPPSGQQVLPYCMATAGGGASFGQAGGNGGNGQPGMSDTSFQFNYGDITEKITTGRGGASFGTVITPSGQEYSSWYGGPQWNAEDYSSGDGQDLGGQCGSKGGYGGGGGGGQPWGGGGSGFAGGQPHTGDPTNSIPSTGLGAGTSYISGLVNTSPSSGQPIGPDGNPLYDNGAVAIQAFVGGTGGDPNGPLVN